MNTKEKIIDEALTLFSEKGYANVYVADIAEIPGVVPLFYSTWADYDKAALAFVEKYPEFREYLTSN